LINRRGSNRVGVPPGFAPDQGALQRHRGRGAERGQAGVHCVVDHPGQPAAPGSRDYRAWTRDNLADHPRAAPGLSAPWEGTVAVFAVPSADDAFGGRPTARSTAARFALSPRQPALRDPGHRLPQPGSSTGMPARLTKAMSLRRQFMVCGRSLASGQHARSVGSTPPSRSWPCCRPPSRPMPRPPGRACRRCRSGCRRTGATAPRLAGLIEGVFGPAARAGQAVSAARRAEGNRRETRPSNPA
jgi:hypothetical protein